MVELYMRLLDLILTPILLLVSVILLLRGHDMPGGGFIAGLLATAAFTMQILGHGAEAVRKSTGRWLGAITGIGLLVAVISATLGALLGDAFFQGQWTVIDIGPIHYKIGTPVTFDIGVFLAVVGVSVTFLLGLSTGIIAAPKVPPEEEAQNAPQTAPAPGATLAGAVATTDASRPAQEQSE